LIDATGLDDRRNWGMIRKFGVLLDDRNRVELHFESTIEWHTPKLGVPLRRAGEPVGRWVKT